MSASSAGAAGRGVPRLPYHVGARPLGRGVSGARTGPVHGVSRVPDLRRDGLQPVPLGRARPGRLCGPRELPAAADRVSVPERMLKAFWHNVVVFALTMIIQNGMALVFAVLLAGRTWGARAYRAIFFMPVVLSLVDRRVPVGAVPEPGLGRGQQAARARRPRRLARPWLGDPHTALLSPDPRQRVAVGRVSDDCVPRGHPGDPGGVSGGGAAGRRGVGGDVPAGSCSRCSRPK